MEYFDKSSSSWKSTSPMLSKRGYLAAVVFEDRIYALGGSDGGVLDTVEYFDKSSSSWKSAPPMLSKRYALAAV